MNKIFKTPIRNFSFHSILKSQERFKISNGVKILIISIAVFGAGFLLVPLTSAQAQNLVVEFEQTPLFNEANFLPGQSVSRWVKVTNNNSGQSQRIATEAINKNDPNRLGDVLNLEIKEGGTTHYNNALSKFFTAGEVFLSNLANNSTTSYDFIVTFYSGAQNPFQGATTTFDILVGFQGEKGGILPGAGTGAGGFLPPGLTILDESATSTAISATSVTIIWTTSYFSTSGVIYDTVPGKFNLSAGPPNYGYTYSKEGDDSGLEKVTGHSVTITGLTPGTTYYYRAVSHGSLAISQEYSFTTLGTKVGKEAEEEILPEEIGIPEIIKEIPKKIAGEIKEIAEKPPAPEGAVSPEGGIVTVPSEERVPGGGLAPLLLASLGVIRETDWMAIVVTICLLGLVVIGIREWELVQKKKKNIS